MGKKRFRSGQVITLGGRKAKLSTRFTCPDCGISNHCKYHNYAYVKWYENYYNAFADEENS